MHIHMMLATSQIKNLDFGGSDSSRISISRGEIPRSMGDFPEI